MAAYSNETSYLEITYFWGCKFININGAVKIAGHKTDNIREVYQKFLMKSGETDCSINMISEHFLNVFIITHEKVR